MPKKAKPIEPPTNAPEAPTIPQATGERFYPPFENAADEDEALVKHAEKWIAAWRKNDVAAAVKALDGVKLTPAQKNRVIIMGQRIAGGLPPIPKKKEKANASQD